jgi:hypothetical protein
LAPIPLWIRYLRDTPRGKTLSTFLFRFTPPLRFHAFRQLFRSGLAVPFFERLFRDFPFDQQFGEFSPLRLTLKRHCPRSLNISQTASEPPSATIFLLRFRFAAALVVSLARHFADELAALDGAAAGLHFFACVRANHLRAESRECQKRSRGNSQKRSLHI